MTKYETYDIKDLNGVLLGTIEATSAASAKKEYLHRQRNNLYVEKKKHVSPYKPETIEHEIHEMIVKKFKENGCFTYPDGSKHEQWMLGDGVVEDLVKGVMKIREAD